MFNNIRCTIPQDVKRQYDKVSSRFTKTVLNEDFRVKELHAQEIQSTAENPRIRAQEETTDISIELRAHKRQEFLEQKRRQQLRENNQELRQLENQLRSAHVTRRLAVQKKESAKQLEEAKHRKAEENKKAEEERICTQEALLEQEAQERRKKEAFRGVLQGQMAETQTRRMKEYEEVLRERDEMQKLLQRFDAEHKAELEDLNRRRQRANLEMKEFVRSQELHKLKARADKRDENEKMFEILREREEEQNRIKTEKRNERDRKMLLSEQIGQQLIQTENEKRRRENLLLDLLVEESKAKEDFRYRKNLEKQAQDRIQVRLELEHYRDDIVRIKQEHQKEEDERMRVEQMRVMAERDKLDQLSDDRRRQKVQDHRRAIQEMMQVKRLQRAAEAADRLRENELCLSEIRKKEQEIDDERLRLLSLESPDILRYLPTGVLRESDREFLALPPNEKQTN